MSAIECVCSTLGTVQHPTPRHRERPVVLPRTRTTPTGVDPLSPRVTRMTPLRSTHEGRHGRPVLGSSSSEVCTAAPPLLQLANPPSGDWPFSIGVEASLIFRSPTLGLRISIRAVDDGTPYSRPMATITCQDCGEQRQRCPKNTRYCKKCRVLRDLDHWQGKQVRTCRAALPSGKTCQAVFAPLGRDDTWCSNCHSGLRAHDGPCGLAPLDEPHTGWPVYSQIPVCADCMRDPQKRPVLIGVLTRGQAERRQANEWSTT